MNTCRCDKCLKTYDADLDEVVEIVPQIKFLNPQFTAILCNICFCTLPKKLMLFNFYDSSACMQFWMEYSEWLKLLIN